MHVHFAQSQGFRGGNRPGLPPLPWGILCTQGPVLALVQALPLKPHKGLPRLGKTLSLAEHPWKTAGFQHLL